MIPGGFKNRTKNLALSTIEVLNKLPRNRTSDVLSRQLLPSGTSVGANYRAACRAKSLADFISKMKIVEEECDETIYWLELLIESGQIKYGLVSDLTKEAEEVLSMVVASIKTCRNRNKCR